ncbi:MAG: helix-turn-helix transcriptional regulator [Eubacteriales bacterium]|nr:helix-turn-helix transcriptional regulator [Eubacteriales bacterium]
MPKPVEQTGEKNLISKNLSLLRKKRGLSQKELAEQLQLYGWDIDKNVITRIETNKRYVADIELKTLAHFFHVSYRELLQNHSENPPDDSVSQKPGEPTR